jgi:septum site-determining protein MinC
MAFVLAPGPAVEDWLAELDDWLARSRGFFLGRPVVLDLTDAPLDRAQISELIQALETRSIRVLGMEGVPLGQCGPELPPLLRPGRTANVAAHQDGDAPAPGRKQAAQSSLLLDTPIRSGQSIVFMEGDITVLGSVGSGAEIVAGGSIHIYGALRGRAMAGVGGNPRARIFCRKIEAELLAIDGYYKTAEDIDPSLLNGPTQAWLDGSKIIIAALN